MLDYFLILKSQPFITKLQHISDVILFPENSLRGPTKRNYLCSENGCGKNALFWRDILSNGKEKGSNGFLLVAFNFPQNTL